MVSRNLSKTQSEFCNLNLLTSNGFIASQQTEHSERASANEVEKLAGARSYKIKDSVEATVKALA